MELSREAGQRGRAMKPFATRLRPLGLFALLLLPSCVNLSPEQNDRIIDSTIPVVREIIIRATK